MRQIAFISLGSNIEPEKHLPLAVQRLTQLGRLVGVSSAYQNPAVGPAPQPVFINAAVLVETGLSVKRIRHGLRRIEADLGRVRTRVKYAPRTIDLDLCLLGDQVLTTSDFQLPDPDLLTRAHLAVPFAELAPDRTHPVTGEPLQAIADRLRPTGSLTLRSDVTARLRDAQATTS